MREREKEREEAEDVEEKMREEKGEKYSRRNLPTSVMPQ